MPKKLVVTVRRNISRHGIERDVACSNCNKRAVLMLSPMSTMRSPHYMRFVRLAYAYRKRTYYIVKSYEEV